MRSGATRKAVSSFGLIVDTRLYDVLLIASSRNQPASRLQLSPLLGGRSFELVPRLEDLTRAQLAVPLAPQLETDAVNRPHSRDRLMS